MRKLKYLILAAVTLAVGSVMTSCSDSSSDTPTPAPMNIIPGATTYSVFATANEAATFSISESATSSITIDRKSVAFTGINASKKTVTVTATMVNGAGYVNATQTATIHFTDANTAAAVVFTFVKQSEESVTKDEIGAATAPVVVNSTDINGFEALMIFQPGTTVDGGTGEPFSITAFELPPFSLSVTDVKTGKMLGDGKAIRLQFTGAGATFSQPVTVKLNVGKGFAGKSVSVISSKGDVLTGVVDADGYLTFVVTSLAEYYDVICDLTVLDKKSGSVNLASFDINAMEGVNTFDYDMKVGCDFWSDDPLVVAYIIKEFGIFSAKESLIASFQTSAAGLVTVSLVQNYVDYTLLYGDIQFVARVWGNVLFDYDDHSGGGSQTGHSGGIGG